MKLILAHVAILLAMNLAFQQAEADEDQQNKVTNLVTEPNSASPPPVSTIAPPPTNKPTSKDIKPAGKGRQDPVNSCPNSCECLETKISCKDNNRWKTLPKLTTFANVTEIVIRNTTIELLDFNQLPQKLERLDLAGNNISMINSAKITFSNLKVIDLSANQLKNLTTLVQSNVKLPVIEELSLALNPLEEIPTPGVFNITRNLRTLKISRTKLKTINENAFNYLSELRFLDISHNRLTSHLGLRQFANNSKLVKIDLSNNSLIEVPFALRSTSSIETLILDGNLLTSLRRSDFINQTSLTTLYARNCPNLTKIDENAFSDLPNLHSLYLSNNPKLSSISKDAFKSDIAREIYNLDLTGDNFTTLFDIAEFQSVRIIQGLLLDNNPWHCKCDLEWFKRSEPKIQAHCKSPELYKDMEVGFYLETEDCEQERSSYHKIILTAFLLFLFALTIGVFVQRSEFCRRLLWKDQYGTIYYTKASFQPEAV